ncbi:PC4 and SFRS1-interacting protein isoform X2 [Lutzomyia longipalpis]|uniref:PC4 and SFRS1-interacting protein isoform X2 n=1 Tax=Lutzomyia longipalpis TaxID=7200 RepID=UPI002483B2C0|nr:PC4 and SFRS1-interacting protein isoform X2 [Lutzomyia longipalpis]
MAKKDRNYKIGDLVFAKVKGYPPWPAKIEKIMGKSKFSVYFYGTGETGHIKPEDLFLYVEYKAKFATERIMKKPYFKEAVEQIEDALKGNDSGPIAVAAAPEVNTADDTAPTDSSLLEPEEKVVEVPQVDVKPSPKAKPEAKQPAKKGQGKKQVNNEVKNEVAPPADKTPMSPPKDNGAEAAAEVPEVKSRSGRKIKPKKYLLEELEEEVVSPPKRKASSLDNTNADVKPAKIPKTDVQSPNQKDMYGELKIHLKNQTKLIDLTTRIKATVGLQRANPDACVKLLEEYNDVQITPIMLLKNPMCVETVKRLRKYVGNVKEWVMSDQEKEEFEHSATEVRKLSQSIYTQFKKMFNNTDGIPFWEFFTNQLQLFDAATKSLSAEEIVQIMDMPEGQKHIVAVPATNDKSTKENQFN